MAKVKKTASSKSKTKSSPKRKGSPKNVNRRSPSGKKGPNNNSVIRSKKASVKTASSISSIRSKNTVSSKVKKSSGTSIPAGSSAASKASWKSPLNSLNYKQFLLVLLRLSLGWTFMWAFLDKMFGLGFSTTPDKAWIAGGSPTYGFLKMASTGPFSGIFHAIGGQPWVNFLFMLALFCIGLALLFGVANRLAGYSGALLYFLMWLVVLPKENNPFMDEHIIHGLLLLLLANMSAGTYFGLGNWWNNLPLVKKYSWLQ